MAFNEQEKQIIIYGKNNGRTKEQVQESLIRYRSGLGPKVTETPAIYEPGPVGAFKESGKVIADQFNKGVKEVSDSIVDTLAGKQGIVDLFTKSAGEVSAFGAKAIEEGVGLGVKGVTSAVDTISDITPQPVKDVLGNIASNIPGVSALKQTYDVLEKSGLLGEAEKIGLQNLQEGKYQYDQWKSANPLKAQRLEAFLNIGNLLLQVSVVKDAAKVGYDAAKGVTGAIKGAARTATEKVSGVTGQMGEYVDKAISPIIKSGSDIVESSVNYVKGAPERAATNLAAKEAERAVIAELPEVGQKAVSNGIAVRDVNQITKATSPEKVMQKELAKDARNFEATRLPKDDPANLVGSEFRKRITALESEQGKVGQKLGEIAKGIPANEVGGLEDAVFARLRAVKGLEGIKIGEDGLLDFSNTLLSTKSNAVGRKAVQEAFDEMAGRTPEQLHKLRQELFEVLGGKKRAGLVLGETEDAGINAIRQGLSDVLDAANPGYKALNMEYAKASDTLKDIRKYFRNVAGSDADILDEAAGKLARRLTSNAVSAPEIRQLIRDMEKILAEKGVKFDVSVDSMQNFLNTLNRYYDIAGDTTLAGQIKLGTEIPTSINSLLGRGVENTLGIFTKTKAVQQKALEDLLEANFLEGAIPKTKIIPQDLINTSKGEHFDFINNEYTPERQNFHKKIVSKFLEGKPTSQKPTIDIITGAPASGKSGYEKKVFTPRNSNNVVIDADKIKPEINKDGIFAHAESSDVAQQIIREAIRNKNNITFVGNIKNTEKYITLLDRLKNEGYTIRTNAIEAPTNRETIHRAIARNLNASHPQTVPVKVVWDGIKEYRSGLALLNKYGTSEIYESTNGIFTRRIK